MELSSIVTFIFRFLVPDNLFVSLFTVLFCCVHVLYCLAVSSAFQNNTLEDKNLIYETYFHMTLYKNFHVIN